MAGEGTPLVAAIKEQPMTGGAYASTPYAGVQSHNALFNAIRAHATSMDLGPNSPRRPGVEPGVTGKEREFQQNRQFGPGAMVPYPFSKPPRSSRGPRPIPSGGEPQRQYKTGSGLWLRRGEQRV